MKFALVINGNVVEEREYPSLPECKIVDGLPVLRAIQNQIPSYDEDLEYPVFTSTYRITDDVVYRIYRIAEKTAEQIKQDERNKAIATGWNTEIGYNLGVDDGDQLAFSKVASGLMFLGAPDAYPMEIKDINGTMHNITFGEFRTLMAGYIPFCYNLWKP